MRIPLNLTAMAMIAMPALAGPLNPDHVPANAAWVVHLDIEAAAGSRVGGFVLENAEAFDLAQGLEDFRNETGLDAVRDLHGITLFGEGDPEQTGVAVLVTSAGVDAIIEQADGRNELDGVTIHSIDADGKTVFLHIADAPRDRRTVTIASDASLVVAAARVQHGETTSMAEAGHDDPEPNPGSILFATGSGLPWVRPEDDAVASILRRTNRVRLNLSETDGMSGIELIVSARNIEDATNISQVLKGGLALGRLASAHSADLQGFGQLLSAVSFSADRNDVRASFDASSDVLIAILGMLAEVE